MDKYAGMTVNERLYVSGLLDEFDKEVEHRNVPVDIELLQKVSLDSSNIDVILLNFGLNPH